ncbi:MAG: hypothetical protein Q7R70_03070 [Candidatus Diapherotrites archaeon]|nr:hypothetical protein [Candidatus Diapherotrites archaeon]
MGFDFSAVKEEAVLFFNRLSLKTWLLVGLFVVCFLLVVFFQLLGLAFGIFLIFAVVAFLILQKSHVSLQEHKEVLVRENRAAEKRFLKHLIDEKTFKKIVSDNERRIIGIDANLKAREEVADFSVAENSALSIRKRHKLKELLEEKKRVVSEFEFAKAKFYKRKIDEKTFQEISMEKQTRLVELDTFIAELYRTEAQEIMLDTARKLKSVKNNSPQQGSSETGQHIQKPRLRQR